MRLFDGRLWLGRAAEPCGAFLAGAALGAAAAVFLATRIGAPVSTTHALIGALAGAGLLAPGAAQVRWTVIAHSILVRCCFRP